MSTEATTTETPTADAAERFAAMVEPGLTAANAQEQPEAATAEPTQEKASATESKPEPSVSELFKAEQPKDEDAKPAKADDSQDDIPEPAELSAKAKSSWQAAKEKRKELEARALAAEKKLAEYEGRVSELEPLKSRVSEYEAKIKANEELVARALLEDAPEFRREFVEGRNKLVAKASQIAEDAGAESGAVAKALSLTGKARTEALREIAGSLEPYDLTLFTAAVASVSELDARAAERRENARKSAEEYHQQREESTRQEMAKFQERRKQQFDVELKTLSKEFPVLRKIDGNDEWNKNVDLIVANARKAMEDNPNTDPQLELMAASAPALKHVAMDAFDKLSKAEARIADLEKQLESRHSKSPSLNGSATTAKSGGATTVDNYIDGWERQVGLR